MKENVMKDPDILGEGDVTGPRIIIDNEQKFEALGMEYYSDIVKTDIKWLWPGHIALGKLNLLAGDAGLGKTMLLCRMTADISNGNPWPLTDKHREPGVVLFASAEDDANDTLKPRLEAAGADMSNVIEVQNIKYYDERGKIAERPFSLKEDVENLGLLIEQLISNDKKPSLLILDPITAFCGGLRNAHDTSEIRGMLGPVIRLLSKYDMALIGNTHLNKSEGGSALNRVTGSLSWIASSRAGFLVTRDEEVDNRRLFLPIKNNLGPDMNGFAYHIEVNNEGIPLAVWDDVVIKKSADDALNSRKARPIDTAEEWLFDILSLGAMSVSDLKAKAASEDISWRTVERAKKELGIKPDKNGYKGCWLWKLPTGTFHVD